jgi:hypothetical protein
MQSPSATQHPSGRASRGRSTTGPSGSSILGLVVRTSSPPATVRGLVLATCSAARSRAKIGGHKRRSKGLGDGARVEALDGHDTVLGLERNSRGSAELQYLRPKVWSQRLSASAGHRARGRGRLSMSSPPHASGIHQSPSSSESHPIMRRQVPEAEREDFQPDA